MKFIFILCFYFIIFVASADIPDGDSVNVDIEHDLTGTFTLRGRYAVPLRAGSGKQLPGFDNAVSSAGDLESFKKLLATNGYYRVRVRNTVADGNQSYFATAAIPACKLQSSGFKEDLSIHLDRNNVVVGLSYSSPIIALPRPCDPALVKSTITFHTRVKHIDTMLAQSLPVTTPGAKPPTLQNVKLDIDKDATGAAQPQQSFLRKYWYIVLVMIIYMFLGKEEPKKGGEKKE